MFCSPEAPENRFRGGKANRWSCEGGDDGSSGTQTFHAQGNQFGGPLLFCFSSPGTEVTHIPSSSLFFFPGEGIDFGDVLGFEVERKNRKRSDSFFVWYLCVRSGEGRSSWYLTRRVFGIIGNAGGSACHIRETAHTRLPTARQKRPYDRGRQGPESSNRPRAFSFLRPGMNP